MTRNESLSGAENGPPKADKLFDQDKQNGPPKADKLFDQKCLICKAPGNFPTRHFLPRRITGCIQGNPQRFILVTRLFRR